MEEDPKTAPEVKKAGARIMGWVGTTTALIGLFGSIVGGATWVITHHKQKVEREQKSNLAQGQLKQGEYQAAIQTYGDILKDNPLDREALDQQVNAAMVWIEDFHFTFREGQDSAAIAATALDQITPILDAGLTRSKGSQGADIQAHLGEAHWFNQKMAHREFGATAEQDFHAALVLDPSNVYANAMLANWMLLNGGTVSDAMRLFDTAVATGRDRTFVRNLEFGSLTYLDKPGSRAAQIRIANDVRTSGEPLNAGYRSRILSFCFNSILTDHGELAESLSAVPPDEAWKTYLWLSPEPSEKPQSLEPDFVEASLLEISGKKTEALAKFKALQHQLPNDGTTMKHQVDAAITRLSRAKSA
jgi:tetratricopeptide (TPR) repeat protein